LPIFSPHKILNLCYNQIPRTRLCVTTYIKLPYMKNVGLPVIPAIPPIKKGRARRMSKGNTFSPVQSRYSRSNWAIGRRVLAMQQANAACLSFLLPAQETGREITYHQTLNWTKWWWTRYISLQSITKLPPSLPHPSLKKDYGVGGEKVSNNNNEHTWFIHVRREGD